MLSPRDPLQSQRHIQMKERGWKKIFHANGNQKKPGIAILVSGKIDFKIKTIKRDTLETNYKRHVIRDKLEKHYSEKIMLYKP